MLAVRGIARRYGPTLALAGADFSLRSGEIHALLGENGAGKSTLLAVMAGMVRPDQGEVLLRGQRRLRWEPGDARRAGIGVVHQQLVQSERHTALENIAFGWPGLGAFPRWKEVRGRVEALAERYGFSLLLDQPVYELSVGERQKVEVVRALFHGAQILLLDEPTAVLTGREAASLHSALRNFRAGGGAVVFTSHKLDEVEALSDRITVLRKGRHVGTFRRGEATTVELASRMVGRPINTANPTAEIQHGAEVLALRGVSVRGPDRRVELMNVSLRVSAGEVLGVAGVAGSGQLALAELLAGLRAPSAGKMRLFGHAVTRFAPAGFARLGVAYIPEDRHRTGAVAALSVAENLIMRTYATEFASWIRLDARRVDSWARQRIEENHISCPGPDAPAGLLSGGNLQKLILARELTGRPELIIAAYPTRGLDIGAAESVRERLLNARWSGGAVVLISEDLDELFRMSDRMIVLYGGRLVGGAARGEASRDQIALWMGGQGSTTLYDLGANATGHLEDP